MHSKLLLIILYVIERCKIVCKKLSMVCLSEAVYENILCDLECNEKKRAGIEIQTIFILRVSRKAQIIKKM